jgi:DNA-binding NtrC family response regulator
MVKARLEAGERTFFLQVRLAISSNPFSDERSAVDREIADLEPDIPDDERVERLTQVVHDRIRKVFAGDKGDVRKFSGNDRTLIENGVLFYLYHVCAADFDRLIQEQVEAGDSPCRVKFAEQTIESMVRFGFPLQDVLRYFAMFFQMRRAFYFINRSIIGRSPCIKRLRRDLWNNVFTHDIWIYSYHLWDRMEDYSTMLLGETGTGKGIAAASVGRSGFIPFDEQKRCFAESFTRAFVSLNLSQFPEQLIESELFGHKKGAFTGAVAEHEGVFSRCSPYGSIFLDEIGDVSVPIQIKLLQVLQERVFSPVGSHEKKRFHGRVIAATNRTIETLRSEGRFRDDFFYRLCSDIISVPPLRKRIQEDPHEIEDLVSFTLKQIVGAPSPDLTEKVLSIIKKQIPRDYAWPGNVRELAQCIRRILLKESYETEALVSDRGDIMKQFIRGIQEKNLNAQELLSTYCKILYATYGTYEEVARRTELDRRTVKKYLKIL